MQYLLRIDKRVKCYKRCNQPDASSLMLLLHLHNVIQSLQRIHPIQARDRFGGLFMPGAKQVLERKIGLIYKFPAADNAGIRKIPGPIAKSIDT